MVSGLASKIIVCRSQNNHKNELKYCYIDEIVYIWKENYFVISLCLEAPMKGN